MGSKFPLRVTGRERGSPCRGIRRSEGACGWDALGLPRRVQPGREDRLSGYEVYFLVAGADFPLGSLEGGFIASSFFFAISA